MLVQYCEDVAVPRSTEKSNVASLRVESDTDTMNCVQNALRGLLLEIKITLAPADRWALAAKLLCCGSRFDKSDVPIIPQCIRTIKITPLNKADGPLKAAAFW